MENKMFRLIGSGSGLMEEIKPVRLELGTIIYFSGYGHDRKPYAVYANSDHNYQRIVAIPHGPLIEGEDTRFKPGTDSIFCGQVNDVKRGICYYHPSDDELSYVGFSSRICPQEVIDKSLALALEAQRIADEERRIENEKIENQRATARSWMKSNVPSWAKSVIVAIQAVDESDLMTDYFHHSTGRVVLLGFSKTDRNNFAEMRKAVEASRFEPVLYTINEGPELVPDSEFKHADMEQRYDGFYLGTWRSKFSGWSVRKKPVTILESWVHDENNICLPQRSAVGESSIEVSQKLEFQPSIYNAKSGSIFHMAVPTQRMDRPTYDSVLEVVNTKGGFYLKFGKGFAFKSEESRDEFINLYK